ncbi:MAG: hypothetical protein RIR70_602 [Pseudomonadota bacterium]
MSINPASALANHPLSSLRLRAVIWRLRQRNGIYFRNLAKRPLPLSKIIEGGVVFDFRTSQYIHFGDLMFFFPLMFVLAARTRVSCIAAPIHQDFLAFLLEGYPGISLIKAQPGNDEIRAGSHGLVITSPYLLGLNVQAWDGVPVIGVGLADEPVDERYPEYLAHACLDFCGVGITTGEVRALTLDWCQAIRRKAEQHAANLDLGLGSENLWLAPYLGSGRFRDMFQCKKAGLLEYAGALAQKKRASIILAGSDSDPAVVLDDVQLIDKRGIKIVDAMCLAASPKILEGVGFDGFWMHFFDILGKPYAVRFRGRYTWAARQLHYQSINVSFCYFTERHYL